MDSSLILKLGKRKRRMRAEKDRLSRLPEYLIDSILERVPVEDAVRTSVLSRNWRYRWTRMRSLILDEHFSEKLARNGGAFGYNGFIRITNQLFNFLEGPILNVHLHIPKNMVVDNFQEVNQWIFSLSRKHNGVRELVLTNSNKLPYQLPSYLFHCSELRKLHLKNCIFKPPSPFDDLNNGFPHLNDLSLSNITFEANLGETVFELPGLEKLELSLCTNVCNFNIKATKLKSLTVEGCHDVKFIRLLDSQRLTDVHLFITEPIPIPRFEERVNLATMLSNLPYLVSLSADGCFLKYSVGEKIPKWLPCAAAANRLLHRLYFIDCNFGQLDQIQGALLLLRNSPNLELLIVMNVCLDRQHLHLDVKPALAYLEASFDCFNQTLNRLKTIKIRRLAGTRALLLLIKLLLDRSPNLELILIEPSITADDHEKDKFFKDVRHFPRASSKAKLRFVDLL